MSKKFAYKTKILFSYVLNAKKWLNIIYFFLESSLNLKKFPWFFLDFWKKIPWFLEFWRPDRPGSLYIWILNRIWCMLLQAAECSIAIWIWCMLLQAAYGECSLIISNSDVSDMTSTSSDADGNVTVIPARFLGKKSATRGTSCAQQASHSSSSSGIAQQASHSSSSSGMSGGFVPAHRPPSAAGSSCSRASPIAAVRQTQAANAGYVSAVDKSETAASETDDLWPAKPKRRKVSK